MPEIKRILYPTDFSELSACAFEYACYLTKQLQAQLHCIHVVDDSYQYWLTFDAATVPAGPPVEDLVAAARKELDKFLAQRLPAGIEPVKSVLHGRAFMEIIRYARTEKIDLIVIGTHGWSALRQVLVGAVADKVIRKSPCPVLSVRHPRHEFAMP